MPKPNIVAIVPAGGVGQRAGTNIPKQYKKINNIVMLRLTVMALLSDARVGQVIVGVAQNDPYIDQALNGLERVGYAFTGGDSRADTVANTINYALENNIINANDWVLVHDAARPGLPKLALKDLIDQCIQQNKGGILAMPAADTVKQAINDLALIEKSLDRNNIWLAQTPQMFPASELLNAIQKSSELGLETTDEASAMEQIYNYNALLVKGSTLNFKVTWPEDFDLIASVLN